MCGGRIRLGDFVKIAESTVSTGLQTHVPSAIATALNIKLGDVLEWHVEAEQILIKKKEGKE